MILQLSSSTVERESGLHLSQGHTHPLTVLAYFLCSSPHQGHYITLVKNGGYWIIFDDDIVEVHPLCVCVCVCASLSVSCTIFHPCS